MTLFSPALEAQKATPCKPWLPAIVAGGYGEVMERGQDSAWVAVATVIGLAIYFGLISTLWKTKFTKKGPKKGAEAMTDEPDNSGKPKKGAAK